MLSVLLSSGLVNKIIEKFVAKTLKEKAGAERTDIQKIELEELDTGNVRIKIEGEVVISKDFLDKLLSEGDGINI